MSAEKHPEFPIIELQSLWNEYLCRVRTATQLASIKSLLHSIRLSDFDNDRSYIAHKRANQYFNTFKFLFEFTMSLNHRKLPLRFELMNRIKNASKINTEQLITSHLTSDAIFEVSMNGYHIFFASMLETEIQCPLNIDELFIVASYLEYSRCALYQLRPAGNNQNTSMPFVYEEQIAQFQHFFKCKQVISRDVFVKFVGVIYRWSVSESTTWFRIQHLQSLNSLKEFKEWDIEEIRKQYQNGTVPQIH
mmetsp:Transcript_56196/g.93648  ORF Transcript_56196/g.93648 Transcript_56196/m.93648 type:complete len:249 (+) Transcript_56196:99-845(+)